MPAYGGQIPEKDRWAIIAYVRALQMAQKGDAVDTTGMTSEQRGELLFDSQTCSTCHTMNGTRVIGPPLNGLMGQEITLDDGTTLVIDEDYILNSITNPMAQARQGYPKAMLEVELTDEDLTDLLNYIKSQK